MLDHPVGRRLAQALSILIDLSLLVVVHFRIIDQSLCIALYLREAIVASAIESFLLCLSAIDLFITLLWYISNAILPCVEKDVCQGGLV